jgi:hypothetical protein
MNSISAAKLSQGELQVESDEFTETKWPINLHPEPLLRVRNALPGVVAEGD